VIPPAVLVLGGLLAADTPALPEGNAYVRALVQKQRDREALLDTYTYDVSSVREELDAAGAVRSRRTQSFQTFYVKGRPLRRLVAEDGQPLSAGRQARENERVAKMAADIRAGRVAIEQPGLRLSAILERFDFRAVDREVVEGRATVVLDFTARPGERDIKGDRVLRRLRGRLWVDEAEQEIVRAEIHNTEPIKVGLGIGASVSRVESRFEFRKVDGVAWLPWRVLTFATGRKLLLKNFRTRLTLTYAGYRRFEVQSEESVRP
jgi:hypothetical protein